MLYYFYDLYKQKLKYNYVSIMNHREIEEYAYIHYSKSEYDKLSMRSPVIIMVLDFSLGLSYLYGKLWLYAIFVLTAGIVGLERSMFIKTHIDTTPPRIFPLITRMLHPDYDSTLLLFACINGAHTVGIYQTTCYMVIGVVLARRCIYGEQLIQQVYRMDVVTTYIVRICFYSIIHIWVIITVFTVPSPFEKKIF